MLASAADAVARVAVREEEEDEVGQEGALLHGEGLLVVSAGDAEDVALSLIAVGVALPPGRCTCRRSQGWERHDEIPRGAQRQDERTIPSDRQSRRSFRIPAVAGSLHPQAEF